MRNVMLRGAAAVFAATIGVSLQAEDNVQYDSSATGAQAEVSVDSSTEGLSTPSTQPLDQSHLNDLPSERALGTEQAIDEYSGHSDTAGTSSADTGDNLSGSGAVTDNSDDSSLDSSAGMAADSPDGSIDASGTIGTDSDTDLSADDGSLGASGSVDVGADSDMSGSSDISGSDADINGSASGDMNSDYTNDTSTGADINADLDAQTASDRQDMSDSATRRPSDDGASLNDNPNDSAPNERGEASTDGNIGSDHQTQP